MMKHKNPLSVDERIESALAAPNREWRLKDLKLSLMNRVYDYERYVRWPALAESWRRDAERVAKLLP